MCVYVKDSLATNVITSNADRPNGVKNVWLSIHCRKLPFVTAGCVYRHPKASQDTFDYKNNTFRGMCLKNRCLYMLGDLDGDLLAIDNKLSTIISMNKQHQIVDKPTRITSQSATLLDVVVTNKRNTVPHVDVTPNIIDNHDLITATIGISKPKLAATMRTFR